MNNFKSLFAAFAVLAIAMAAVIAPVTAEAKTVKIRVQSVIPSKADEVTMLKDFAANVAALTNNEVQIEVLPAGAVVGVKETLEAVDKGLIEGGFAWTHYWSGYHPAAMLFGITRCRCRRGYGQHRLGQLVPVRRRARAL